MKSVIAISDNFFFSLLFIYFFFFTRTYQRRSYFPKYLFDVIPLIDPFYVENSSRRYK